MTTNIISCLKTPINTDQGRSRQFSVPFCELRYAALIVLLFFMSNRALEAQTESVSTQKEDGRQNERFVPTDELRIGISLTSMMNVSGDSSLNWLEYGLPAMLAHDLSQDLVFETSLSHINYRKRESGFTPDDELTIMQNRYIAQRAELDYFVIGSFTQQGDTLKIVSSLHETKGERPICENTFIGTDVFQLVDDMSLTLKQDLKSSEQHAEETVDLPIVDIFTNSTAALKAFFTGLDFKRSSELATSIEYFDKAVQADPTFSAAHLELWYSYDYLGETEKAESSFQAAMQHDHKIAEKDRLVANIWYYKDKQNYEKALIFSEMWVKLRPNDKEAYEYYATASSDMGLYDQEIWARKQLLKLDPDNAYQLLSIGRCYRDQEQYGMAADYFKEYTNKNPNETSGYSMLAELYENYLYDYEQAKNCLLKAIRVEPNSYNAYFRLVELARLEFKTGNFKEALHQYDQALSLCKSSEDSVVVYTFLQTFYSKRGRLEKSFDCMYKKWKAKEKYYSDPLMAQRGKLFDLDLFIKAGKNEAAFQILKSAETQFDDSNLYYGDLLYHYVKVYWLLEDKDRAEQALENFESWIVKSGDDSRSGKRMFARGKIHEMKGEYAQALQDYQTDSVPELTNENLYPSMGRCYRKVNELEKAEDCLKNILKKEPYDPESLYEIALVYRDMNHKERAFEHLAKALTVWENADPNYRPAQKAGETLTEWEKSQ